jgi:hypothetical protein
MNSFAKQQPFITYGSTVAHDIGAYMTEHKLKQVVGCQDLYPICQVLLFYLVNCNDHVITPIHLRVICLTGLRQLPAAGIYVLSTDLAKIKRWI